jgi:hypothetical protein
LADRVTGRDRSWVTLHPATFSLDGISHLAIRYSLRVEVEGDWQLTAIYTKPPCGDASSKSVITSKRSDRRGELGSPAWRGRHSECVTVVRQILAEIAHSNGVTLPQTPASHQ